MTRRASELAAQRAPFVTATVVRTQRPTSARPGDVALVLGDGTIEGFVGGVCAQHSVRVYALKTIESRGPVLLRILPDGSGEQAAEDEEQMISAGEEVSSEEGAVTVKNTCLSGGAIEVFLEPVIPAPRVLVVGDAPIAGAIHRIGDELGLEIVTVEKNGPEPTADDLAVVVAGHGRDEYDAIRRGLEAGVPYVGLVASHKRGKAVLDDLREDGVPAGLLELVDVPAGINIGAREPGEIAVSILAKIVSVRREERVDAHEPAGGLAVHHAGGRAHEKAPARAKSATTNSAAPIIAVDPICGMTVAAVPGTPSVEHDGETIYFCCDGCKAKYEAQHQHATAAG
ncbi:MAG TPA: XdhC family protein [Solirubrobacteraceae bacterium]|nr:XdhC family protein [Solirubrobacteraceae bacterium]